LQENLPATGEDQSERCPEPGGRAGRNADRASLGYRSGAASETATTNPIESCLSTVQRVARNVKRWREGDQPLRWTATGLLEAEKKFQRIKEYQEILLRKERLNPSRLPQKEVRTVEVA